MILYITDWLTDTQTQTYRRKDRQTDRQTDSLTHSLTERPIVDRFEILWFAAESLENSRKVDCWDCKTPIRSSCIFVTMVAACSQGKVITRECLGSCFLNPTVNKCILFSRQRAKGRRLLMSKQIWCLRYYVISWGLLNDLPYGVVQIIEWITLLVKVKINSHASVRVVSWLKVCNATSW